MNWLSHEKTLVLEFLECFKCSSAVIGSSEANPFSRKIMVDRPLRGLGANTVLIGKGRELDRWLLEKYVMAARAARTLLIVLAMDSDANCSAQAFQDIERDKLVVVGRPQLESLLESQNPHDAFLQIVRDQISFLALVPFETSAPACGPQFTGRSTELRKLQSNQDFAVYGPGGIGKSSLLRQWMWLRRLYDSEAYERTIEVDLQDLSEPDDAARRIVTSIEKKVSVRSGTADGVIVKTFADTVEALHRENSRRLNTDQPLCLILDEVGGLLEVDKHREFADYFQNVNSTGRDRTRFPLLHVIRNLTSRGILRVTLCARESTRSLLENEHNPFCVPGGVSRLKPLEIRPLDENEAKKMLTSPLACLGVDLAAHSSLINDALMKSKGVPVRLADAGLDIALEAEPDVRRRRIAPDST
jgi:hypothetical protein